MSAAERAEQKLVESLPIAFFELAKQDATLAIAMKSLADLIEDGLFPEAVKLSETITRRLELLAMKRTLQNSKLKLKNS